MSHKKKAVLYVHGQGGSAKEAEQYRDACRGRDVIGVDYAIALPWVTPGIIREAWIEAAGQYDSVILIANSIGAYFSMLGLSDCSPERALFVSPVTDMEQLIRGMMARANVTPEELSAKKEIRTPSGEILSSEYLDYVCAHPLRWRVPTSILYGERDALISLQTVQDFAAAHAADLTVMPGGEHWFHTEEQMDFLLAWVGEQLASDGSCRG